MPGLEALEPRLHLARPDPSPAENVYFRLPLAEDTTTHFYFDRDPTTAAHAWDGSTHTYDGHTGSDFSGGPRGKPIYAAADGILTAVVDGFPDQGGSANGNYVKINHGNDRNGNPITTFYLHMNAGTPTTKSIGSFIAAGELIGGVGTSGNSTGLHLHFHTSLAGAAFDPFAATGSSETSWWVNQNGGSPTTTANTVKFLVGDTAQVYDTTSLNVRAPNPSGSSAGTRTSGMTGTVLEGPVYAAFSGNIDSNLWVWYRVHWSDGLEGWSAQNWLRKPGDFTSPTVASSNFLYNATPHTATFTFSEDVGTSVTGSDFVVTKAGGGTINKSFGYDPSTRTATLNFLGTLQDGDYHVAIPAGSVSDSSGNSLASDYNYDFFVLAADADRSRTVDTIDFNILASNFSKTGLKFSDGDFNYDSSVDTIDFNILTANFSRSLSGAVEKASALPARPARADPIAPMPGALSSLADIIEGPRDAEICDRIS